MFLIIKEANNSSMQILTQAVTSDKFKDNENARNTVIRANDLFYALSEEGYNVFVNISNDGTTELKFPIIGRIRKLHSNYCNKSN